MNDEIWKDFFADNQTKRVLDSSEVWRNYSQSELAREQFKKANTISESIDRENQIMSDIDSFRQNFNMSKLVCVGGGTGGSGSLAYIVNDEI